MLETVAELLLAPPSLGDFNPHSTLTPSGCPIEWTFSSHNEEVRYTLDLHPRQVPSALKKHTEGLDYCWLSIQRTSRATTHQLLKLHDWNDPDPLYLEDCVPVLSGFRGTQNASEVHYLHQEPAPAVLENLLKPHHSQHLSAFWNDLRFLTARPSRTLPRKTPITIVMQSEGLTLHIPASALFSGEDIARQKLAQWFTSAAYTEAMQHSGLMHTTVGWEFQTGHLTRLVGVTLKNWR
ncbi:hypothetical protein [Deinococcus roseus]|uniref:Uncharacterized protein n=1 Tax=Deinococcus roseus TaxID=392414 RepID=A0ABQ2CZX6_9DEIO|nr:hypothetical protein [Deinococcus roseus]GGJ37557.1 hypothetical protein GCM10008938_24620 [Deinococcus roseus]